MIRERVQIVAIYPDFLLVEGVNKRVCDVCDTENGCGEEVLQCLPGKDAGLKIFLDGREPDDFHLTQIVTIGLPEGALLKGTFFVYMTPLLGLVAGVGLGQFIYGSDPAALLGAIVGLIGGGAFVKRRSDARKNNPALRPVLLDNGR